MVILIEISPCHAFVVDNIETAIMPMPSMINLAIVELKQIKLKVIDENKTDLNNLYLETW